MSTNQQELIELNKQATKIGLIFSPAPLLFAIGIYTFLVGPIHPILNNVLVAGLVLAIGTVLMVIMVLKCIPIWKRMLQIRFSNG